MDRHTCTSTSHPYRLPYTVYSTLPTNRLLTHAAIYLPAPHNLWRFKASNLKHVLQPTFHKKPIHFTHYSPSIYIRPPPTSCSTTIPSSPCSSWPSQPQQCPQLEGWPPLGPTASSRQRPCVVAEVARKQDRPPPWSRGRGYLLA